jgi:hypothetical protein
MISCAEDDAAGGALAPLRPSIHQQGKHMNTKRLLSALLAASVIGSAGIQASETETIFLPDQGKLIIPHLILNNEIFYVQLNRTNPTTYNFNLDVASVTKITPQPGDDWAMASELVGDWSATDIEGPLGIFANGNYSIVTAAEEDCPAGTETGTWSFDEDTGVFFARALVDGNGDCGLSHPDGVVRIKRVGANLEVMVTETANGQQMTGTLILVPL